MSDEKEKVVKLSSWTGDAKYDGIEEMLEAAKRFHEQEKKNGTEGNRAICIFLDDRGGAYRVAWQAARMTPTKITSLMSYVKINALFRLLGVL